VDNPLELEEFPSSKLLKDADLIINLPKIKTHGQCTLTCCIKNMFGTILRTNKAKTHAQFPSLDRFTSALTDIYSVSNPQLTVIDGYLAMEGNGPGSGDPVKMDLILAGYDGVALDTTVCKITQIPATDVKYLAFAEKKGLGTTDLSTITYLGEKPENVTRKFKLPGSINAISAKMPKKLANYISNTVFKARIKFDKNRCILCGTCWENCPVNAIKPPEVRKKGNIPVWDKNKCITCYCCAELCPEAAVDAKVNVARNAIFSWFGVAVFGILAVLGTTIGLLIRFL
jgi:ferredoxin